MAPQAERGLPTAAEIHEAARRLEGADPRQTLAWLWERFGSRAMISTGLGIDSTILIHLAAEVAPGLPVLFIDTGYHFPESLAFVADLRQRYPNSWEVVTPHESLADHEARLGPRPFARDPDACCAARKVAPMARALARYDGWATGLRRDQSPERAATPVVALKERPGGGGPVVKVAPLAAWTREESWRFAHAQGIPYHPLFDQGYASLGCAPCTRPVVAGEGDERAGRWAGQGKSECGLHTFLG